MVDAATRLILDLFSDFPFATKADKANFISMLLQPIVRKLINGATPIYIINASRPNSGKTLLVDLVWRILLGTDPNPMGWGDQEAEQEKLITTALMAGKTILYFDNLKPRKLDSSVLAKVATQETWSGSRWK